MYIIIVNYRGSMKIEENSYRCDEKTLNLWDYLKFVTKIRFIYRGLSQQVVEECNLDSNRACFQRGIIHFKNRSHYISFIHFVFSNYVSRQIFFVLAQVNDLCDLVGLRVRYKCELEYGFTWSNVNLIWFRKLERNFEESVLEEIKNRKFKQCRSFLYTTSIRSRIRVGVYR